MIGLLCRYPDPHWSVFAVCVSIMINFCFRRVPYNSTTTSTTADVQRGRRRTQPTRSDPARSSGINPFNETRYKPFLVRAEKSKSYNLVPVKQLLFIFCKLHIQRGKLTWPNQHDRMNMTEKFTPMNIKMVNMTEKYMFVVVMVQSNSTLRFVV